MNATLATSLWPAARSNWLYELLLAVAGSLLLAISAQIKVPFWPVPMTMQVLAVLLIGIGFGWKLGVATVLLYWAEGALGLPVFAKGNLAAYFTGPMPGPTLGYLASYPIAAGIAGWMTEGGRGRSFWMALLGCAMALVVIYIGGYSWLRVFFGPQVAWFSGVQMFLAVDCVKVLIAALISQTAWRQVSGRQGS